MHLQRGRQVQITKCFLFTACNSPQPMTCFRHIGVGTNPTVPTTLECSARNKGAVRNNSDRQTSFRLFPFFLGSKLKCQRWKAPSEGGYTHPFQGDFMASTFKAAAIAKNWIHSHEEDAEGTQVFRPAGYPFPSARGRDALALDTDGTLRRTIPGPDDRSSQMPAGSWKLDGRRLILQQQGSERKEFSIESVSPDRLLLRPLKTSS